jgi:pimeloyl-ACP methyl ester carboxylesterase
VLHAGGRAWLDIAATPDDDFYAHRLADIACPVLAIHGTDDPRTEPGELDRLTRELPHARVHWIAGAGHAPHAERAASAETTEVGASFLRGLL